MTGILNALIAGVSGAVKDAYFNLVSLLLPGNGTNGANNNAFLDSSGQNGGAGWTITRNPTSGPNAPTQGTFSPFSQTGWGNYFNGSSSILETSTSIFGTWSTANASTTTATIEAMVYVNALQSAPANAYQNPSIINKGNTYLNFSVNSTGNIVFFHYDGSFRYITSSGTIQANTWNYVAVTITGGTATIYINGTSSGSGTWYGIQTGGLVAPTYIGQTPTGQYWNGYISNLRVSSIVRTIATPLVPYTNDGNTSLLTCQSNRFRDASTNGYTITATGSPSVVAFSPFAPTQSYSASAVGGSGYFDGTGDYVQAASNAAFAIGTGDFAIECFVYFTGTAQGGGISGELFGSTTTGSIVLRYKSGTLALSRVNTADDMSASVTLTPNQWYHICATRTGTTGALYLNGARVGTASSYTASYAQGDIGTINNTQGYLTCCRLIKAANPYGTDTTITVPTAPLTAVSGTSLLLNFTNAGVVDATAKNVLETVGDAQISTTQSKWGGGSIFFNPSAGSATDYLLSATPLSELAFLNNGSPWTVEGWFYTGSTSAQTILSTNAASATVGINIGINSTAAGDIVCGIYRGVSGSSLTAASSGSAWSTNTWVYFAVVLDASKNLKIYINGSQVATTSGSSFSFSSSNPTYPLVIGRYQFSTPGEYFNGYIDDLRITRGVARTITASPTAPFPVQ